MVKSDKSVICIQDKDYSLCNESERERITYCRIYLNIVILIIVNLSLSGDEGRPQYRQWGIKAQLKAWLPGWARIVPESYTECLLGD